MTFYEGFMQCKTIEELHEEVAQVRSFAVLFGDIKSIKAIEDAKDRVIKEKGWSDEDSKN